MAASTEHERLEEVLLGQSQLVFQVHLWLDEEQKRDDLIRALILSSRKHTPVPMRGLDPDRIYSARTIERLCVKYRLRFLPGSLFKGPVPPQAVQAVRALERKADGPLTSFMVMAPSKRFTLCDGDVDPLLFLPLDEERYYLVHKWGKDLSAARAVAYWPVRAPQNLIITVVAAAALVTILFPGSLLAPEKSWFFTVERLQLLFWCVMCFAGFTAFGWMAFFGQFSKQAWNSRYFN